VRIYILKPLNRSMKYECYKWTNKVNGKSYIGWCKTGWDSGRWYKHQADARTGSQFAFARAIRKYGAENFKGTLLAEAETEADIKYIEILKIKEYQTQGSLGYNLTVGGDGGYENPWPNEEEAFLARVEKAPSGCWLWVGNVTREGYGRFCYQSKTESAAKASVRIFKGIELPKGRKGGIVTAICMNPICVKPQHLEIVSDTKDPVKLRKWNQFRVECSKDVVEYRVTKTKIKRKLMKAYEEWLKTT